MASEYDQLTGTKRYSKQASHWLGNVLGGNAWASAAVVCTVPALHAAPGC